MQRTTLLTRVTPVTGHAVRSRAGPVEPSLCDVRRVDRGRVPRDLQGAGPAAPAHYDHYDHYGGLGEYSVGNYYCFVILKCAAVGLAGGLEPRLRGLLLSGKFFLMHE